MGECLGRSGLNRREIDSQGGVQWRVERKFMGRIKALKGRSGVRRGTKEGEISVRWSGEFRKGVKIGELS